MLASRSVSPLAKDILNLSLPEKLRANKILKFFQWLMISTFNTFYFVGVDFGNAFAKLKLVFLTELCWKQ